MVFAIRTRLTLPARLGVSFSVKCGVGGNIWAQRLAKDGAIVSFQYTDSDKRSRKDV